MNNRTPSGTGVPPDLAAFEQLKDEAALAQRAKHTAEGSNTLNNDKMTFAKTMKALAAVLGLAVVVNEKIKIHSQPKTVQTSPSAEYQPEKVNGDVAEDSEKGISF